VSVLCEYSMCLLWYGLWLVRGAWRVLLLAVFAEGWLGQHSNRPDRRYMSAAAWWLGVEACGQCVWCVNSMCELCSLGLSGVSVRVWGVGEAPAALALLCG
jgi:hypothetical protein